MMFSVIIPVRNRPAEIARCVASVLACDWPAAEREVIVVDNGSTDATARAAADAGARVMTEPQPNRCRARNRGAEAARGRWLAFIDSDCLATPSWLAELALAIDQRGEDPRLGAVAGAILPATPATPVEAYVARRRWIDQETFLAPGRRFSPPFAATANLAIRREAFEAVGGFDPDLATAGEDADWCWRAAEAGWTLDYAPRAAVIHYHRATLGGLWRQAFAYGVGNAELFAKWRGRWGARSWIEPRFYVWSLKGWLRAPWAVLAGATPLERREPLYDALANLAQALGRLWGGLRRGVCVL